MAESAFDILSQMSHNTHSINDKEKSIQDRTAANSKQRSRSRSRSPKHQDMTVQELKELMRQLDERHGTAGYGSNLIRERMYDPSSKLIDHLPDYEPLLDENLKEYFGTAHMQRHLRNLGLIEKDGSFVPTGEWKTRQALMDTSERMHSRKSSTGQIDINREVDLSINRSRSPTRSTSPSVGSRPASRSRSQSPSMPSMLTHKSLHATALLYLKKRFPGVPADRVTAEVARPPSGGLRPPAETRTSSARRAVALAQIQQRALEEQQEIALMQNWDEGFSSQHRPMSARVTRKSISRNPEANNVSRPGSTTRRKNFDSEFEAEIPNIEDQEGQDDNDVFAEVLPIEIEAVETAKPKQRITKPKTNSSKKTIGSHKESSKGGSEQHRPKTSKHTSQKTETSTKTTKEVDSINQRGVRNITIQLEEADPLPATSTKEIKANHITQIIVDQETDPASKARSEALTTEHTDITTSSSTPLTVRFPSEDSAEHSSQYREHISEEVPNVAAAPDSNMLGKQSGSSPAINEQGLETTNNELKKIHMSSNYVATPGSPAKDGSEPRAESHSEIQSNHGSRFSLFKRKLTGSKPDIKDSTSDPVHV